ncbi:MAG: hypothetical protein ABSA11_12930 [Candidatus Bathyarchaeia archaeon]|jgi:hypothetical protein
MPIQIFFLKYSPENDSRFNEKVLKVTMDLMAKREGLLKKHGIKDLGLWLVPTEHLTIIVDEASSLDAFQKLLMEPEFVAINAYCSIETKVAITAEEAMKMMRGK